MDRAFGQISDTANSAIVLRRDTSQVNRLELPDWLCPRSALRETQLLRQRAPRSTKHQIHWTCSRGSRSMCAEEDTGIRKRKEKTRLAPPRTGVSAPRYFPKDRQIVIHWQFQRAEFECGAAKVAEAVYIIDMRSCASLTAAMHPPRPHLAIPTLRGRPLVCGLKTPRALPWAGLLRPLRGVGEMERARLPCTIPGLPASLQNKRSVGRLRRARSCRASPDGRGRCQSNGEGMIR